MTRAKEGDEAKAEQNRGEKKAGYILFYFCNKVTKKTLGFLFFFCADKDDRVVLHKNPWY